MHQFHKRFVTLLVQFLGISLYFPNLKFFYFVSFISLLIYHHHVLFRELNFCFCFTMIPELCACAVCQSIFLFCLLNVLSFGLVLRLLWFIHFPYEIGVQFVTFFMIRLSRRLELKLC